MQLTEQLQRSVTENDTQQWLTNRQEEITAHRRELINTIRQASDIWRQAAESVAKHERGCLIAQRCITG